MLMDKDDLIMKFKYTIVLNNFIILNIIKKFKIMI